MNIDRRKFLLGSAATVALAGCATRRQGSRPLKPGEKRTVAMIGCGIQQRHLIREFANPANGVNARIAAVCDCDRRRASEAGRYVESRYKDGSKCRVETDFRKILDDPSIDMVCVATPDHWHAYICVEAMKRGKDVYCEKPLTWSVEEAVEMMKAEKKYGRIFQTGSMQRSWREFRDAVSLVRGGLIGNVVYVDANFGDKDRLTGGPSHPARFWYKPENAAKEGAPNPDVDWEMWLGPAARRPYSDQLSPRGVHNFFPMFWRCDDDLANGYCGDWGAHQLDIAQWGLDCDSSGPVRVIRSDEPHSTNLFHGGRRQFGLGMVFRKPWGDVLLRHGSTALNWGTVFYGEKGIVAVNRDRIAVWTGTGLVKPTAEIRKRLAEGSFMPEKRFAFSSGRGTPALAGELDKIEKAFAAEIAKAGVYRSENHVRNFCECVETRKPTITPASVGCRTSILCRLCNTSYKYDTGFDWDPDAFRFANGTGRNIPLGRPGGSNGWEVEA